MLMSEHAIGEVGGEQQGHETSDSPAGFTNSLVASK